MTNSAKIVDVMVDVRKLSYVKERRKKKKAKETIVIQNEMEMGSRESAPLMSMSPIYTTHCSTYLMAASVHGSKL